MDAGAAHIRDQVLPTLMQLDGFVGLSMMLDRNSGRCVVTTAWQSAEAMHATADKAGQLRNRAAEIFGGSPEVDEWEIAVMHRDHPTHDGACVRVAWVETDPDRMDDLIATFKMGALPQLEALDGFCSSSFMVNRSSGRAVSATCFESRMAMDAAGDQARQIRTSGTQQANATVLDVREFELALGHLRVPEMA